MYPWQSSLFTLGKTTFAPSFKLHHLAPRPVHPQHKKQITCLSKSHFVRSGSGISFNRIPYNSCSDHGRVGSSAWHLQKATFSSQVHAFKNNEDVGFTVIQSSWVYKYLPSPFVPFVQLARLDKPIGAWLLAWPFLWSIALAAPAGRLPDIKMITLLGLGSILLRAAGCTINDLVDRDIDKQVERTKLRPIASGAVTPFQGFCFFAIQLFMWLGVLLQLNWFSQILGVLHIPFVVAYPYFKRWTYWPQAFLGLTMNWGVLLGWSAIKGSIDMSVVGPLYLSAICWTLDKSEDVKIGVKSTALYFGDQTKLWLTGFGIICIGSLFVSGYYDGLGWIYNSSLLAAAAHLYWQVSKVDIHNPADCNRKFVSNKWFGAIVFTGILAAKLSQAVVV